MELRAIRPDEVAEYTRTIGLGFGHSMSEKAIELRNGEVEPERTRVVFDGDRMVATSGALTFRLATCGGGEVGASGITAVTVRTTHRRRGLLRQMMTALLDDAAERNEPVAILLASEAGIYGRFGFGQAADACRVRLDRRTATLRPFDDPGTIDRAEGKDLGDTVKGLYARWWPTRPGAPSFTPGWFGVWLADDEGDRDGGSELICAVHRDGDGNADGYVVYRLKPTWTDGNPDGTVRVTDLVAMNDTAHLALWQHLLSIDLMTTVEAFPRPLDDPIRWALTDPRHARIDLVTDFLWVRPLDVAAMLAARSYRIVDDVVLDVVDDTRPQVGGRFRLTTSADG
ncbi:MAG: GNAT family N-acetyltransferase, partial [Actinomycetota bacterium]|nr:GNAT family N-acetyltransferase [Actinomycetota bacterium]